MALTEAQEAQAISAVLTGIAAGMAGVGLWGWYRDHKLEKKMESFHSKVRKGRGYQFELAAKKYGKMQAEIDTLQNLSEALSNAYAACERDCEQNDVELRGAIKRLQQERSELHAILMPPMDN